MSTLKANFSLSISSSASISVIPNREQNSQRLFSDDLLHFLLDDQGEQTHNQKLDVLKESMGDESETARQFSSLDENAPTIRSDCAVMCINCYENIEVDFIDKHSVGCVQPIFGDMEVENKLREFLDWVRDLRFDCREVYVYPLILLEDITKKVLKNRNELLLSLERLNSINQDYQNLPKILQASQRLTFLLENLSAPSPSKLQLDFLELNPNTSKAHHESFLSSFSDCSEIIKPCLSPSGSPETLEKYFYSQCLKAKLSAPSKKTIPISTLFQQCQEQSIPIDQWKSFIHSSFFIDD